MENKFVHIVNFWLKPNLSPSEINAFEAGVKSLEKIDSLIYYNLGKPASTDRPVIDRSYSYCLLTVFKDLAGHDVYQEHPIHLAFVDSCKKYWDKVLIYDSETV
ncbi:MAG: Dabb family protein [Bacteroidota bacterium]|nr:Dabb family protein [Bacteroidota bacterium]